MQKKLMPKRMTRKESNADTRRRLLAAAAKLFTRNGYARTSVDMIAAEAGFTKGAVYANFPTKAGIFLEVFEDPARAELDGLIRNIGAAPDRAAVEELLVKWAGRRARSGAWSLTILEFARRKEAAGAPLERLRELLHRRWTLLGEAVLERIPAQMEAVVLGATLHELANAPAMTIMKSPDAGDIMQAFLDGLPKD